MIPKVLLLNKIGSVLLKGDIETNILEKNYSHLGNISTIIQHKESSNKLSIKLILSLQVQVYIKI